MEGKDVNAGKTQGTTITDKNVALKLPIILGIVFLITFSGYFGSLYIGGAKDDSDQNVVNGLMFTRNYIDRNYGGNGRPGWVRAGDMDSDGDIDIVAGGGRALFIYENDGSAAGWKRYGNSTALDRWGPTQPSL